MISSIAPPIFSNSQIMTFSNTFIFIPPFIFSTNRFITSIITMWTILLTRSNIINFFTLTLSLTRILISNTINTTYKILMIITNTFRSTFSNRNNKNTFTISPTRIKISSSIITTDRSVFTRTLFTINTFSFVSYFNSCFSCITRIFVSSAVTSTNWLRSVIITSIFDNSTIGYHITTRILCLTKW